MVDVICGCPSWKDDLCVGAAASHLPPLMCLELAWVFLHSVEQSSNIPWRMFCSLHFGNIFFPHFSCVIFSTMFSVCLFFFIIVLPVLPCKMKIDKQKYYVIFSYFCNLVAKNQVTKMEWKRLQFWDYESRKAMLLDQWFSTQTAKFWWLENCKRIVVRDP